MAQQKTAKLNGASWLVRIIKIGLFASLFMPLIINSAFIFPYIFPKQAFFQILVEILFGLYIFLAFLQPQYRPRSSKLFLALLIYFAVMVLSSVFGVNTYHSFWSDYERMAGVISLVHYLGFLFIAANIFKTDKDWYRFFDVSIFVSLLEALYSIGQALNLTSVAYGGSGARLDGTIGNPSFLAGYMLLNALFAFWLALEKKDIRWRLFYAGVIVINIFVLYKTATRGAVLALAIGLFILFLSFVFSPRQAISEMPFKQTERLRKYAIFALILFLLVIGILWLARDSSFILKNPTLARVTHITLQDATVQTRFLAWRMSLRGFLERPIFGWGMENYQTLFNKYYDPHLYPVESWFDRSHNAYLDVLVTTGLVGFLAYIGIFVLAFWFLWRGWRQGKIKYQTMVIFAVILISYAIQNFFLFDTQVTLLMIYLILSFIVFLSRRGEEPVGQPIKPNFFFVGVVGLLVVFCVYFVNVRPGLASEKGIQAAMLFGSGKISESVSAFRDAFSQGTFGMPEIATRAQDAAMQIISGTQEYTESQKDMIKTAIDGLNRAINDFEPQNVRFMQMLSNIYLSAAQFDPSYLKEADLILQKALELSPTRQELLFAMAQLKMFEGRTNEVLPYVQKAVEINDSVNISHWNYGIFAIALGQQELGQAEINKAIQLGHLYGVRDINLLINAYGRVSNWPKIVSLYQEWIALTPGDATPYAGLAATFAQAGDKQKAKEWALKAAEVDPSFKEQADSFINSLGI